MALSGDSKFSKKPHSSEVQIQKLQAENEALRRFVPSVVREAIARDPSYPSLQRRMQDLSVLFVDIAGCTRLCEVLPPKRMQEFIEKYFSSFIDDVYSLGGTVNETGGDGLMILFLGDPPNDHAISACLAASLIQSRTKEFEINWGEECWDLAVHIGVNSGPASLGVMEFTGTRVTRGTFTATGPVTNIAARLAALAPAGKTYIGKETWQRSGNSFEGSSMGMFDLKNVSQPVEIFDLH